MKLDLGASSVSPPGFVPMGHAHGSEIFPLPHADGTIDEIRASHVLEHFPHSQIAAVLADWVRVLRPGGRLKIAVPDFEEISRRYLAGEQLNVQGYLMGGQSDCDDFHRSAFDMDELRRKMAAAGLLLIRKWASDIQDCAALPISLNLEGTKPFMPELGVSALCSMPRVTWTDNAMTWVEAITPLNIKFRAFKGAYWGQCLERGLEEVLRDDKPDAILTLDYDSVFTRRDVAMLMQLMMAHPEADAIAALQSHRHTRNCLFTITDDEGQNVGALPIANFSDDLTRAATAHFGLTLIRADKLAALPKPWFHGRPDSDGGWGDGKVDEDIAFWHAWERAGNSLYLANRVPIGHIEVMIRWPGRDLQVTYQSASEYRNGGPPEGSWK